MDATQIKEGDIVAWRGVNHMVTGRVARLEEGGRLAVFTKWGPFMVRDVCRSVSFRIVKHA